MLPIRAIGVYAYIILAIVWFALINFCFDMFNGNDVQVYVGVVVLLAASAFTIPVCRYIFKKTKRS